MKTLLTLALLTMGALPALAQETRVDGIRLGVQPVAEGLDEPVFVGAAPGEDGLFIVEKPGRILRLQGGELAPEAFLDLSELVGDANEQGLLGLTFHPGFAENGRFFVYYTERRGDIILAEGHSAPGAAIADAGLRLILTIPHDMADNHNGGWLDFGPDGLLYIGTGDGGGGGDPAGNGQNPDALLGKILRIDVNSGSPYAIPPANPFAKGGGAPEVFALGLRNPWRASFDGDNLYVGDVGQGDWEEIHLLTPADAGANLGWNRVEGVTCFATSPCDQTGLTPPVHVYGHDIGCSVTGGLVYRGTAMPALRGRYLFADFCGGSLMSFRVKDGVATDVQTATAGLVDLGQISHFGTDSAGEVLVVTLDGSILKLVPGAD